jgi:hypothetical protein
MGQDVTVLIASDAQASAARTRAALLRQGLSCPHSHIVSLDLAAQVARDPHPKPVARGDCFEDCRGRGRIIS